MVGIETGQSMASAQCSVKSALGGTGGSILCGAGGSVLGIRMTTEVRTAVYILIALPIQFKFKPIQLAYTAIQFKFIF